MRRFIVLGGFLALLYPGGPVFAAPKPGSAVNGRAALAMSVTQEASEEQRIADVLENYAPLANYLSAVARTQIKIGYSRNMTAELQRTRTASVDILVGPAHIIGSALRYGYEPLATFSGSEKMVFVVPEASAIKCWRTPGQASRAPERRFARRLPRARRVQLQGLQLKSYFREIRNYSSHEIALYALEMNAVDVAVAEYRVAEKWLSKNKAA